MSENYIKPQSPYRPTYSYDADYARRLDKKAPTRRENSDYPAEHFRLGGSCSFLPRANIKVLDENSLRISCAGLIGIKEGTLEIWLDTKEDGTRGKEVVQLQLTHADTIYSLRDRLQEVIEKRGIMATVQLEQKAGGQPENIEIVLSRRREGKFQYKGVAFEIRQTQLDRAELEVGKVKIPFERNSHGEAVMRYQGGSGEAFCRPVSLAEHIISTALDRGLSVSDLALRYARMAQQLRHEEN